MTDHPMDALVAANADHVSMQTLVGVQRGPYPLRSGNCFSVFVPGHDHRRVINFVYENLTELIKAGVIQWPLRVLLFQDDLALVHDERIPHDWYTQGWCEVCTPQHLLPPPQRLRHLRDIATGRRTERDGCITIRLGPIEKETR